MSDRKVAIADLETVLTYVDNLRNLSMKRALDEKRSFIRSFGPCCSSDFKKRKTGET
jgi:hypothetical protein